MTGNGVYIHSFSQNVRVGIFVDHANEKLK